MDNYVTGVKVKFGSMYVIYRDAQGIKQTGSTLTFNTCVICTGNSIAHSYDDDGKVLDTYRVFRQRATDCACCCSDNPVLIDYDYMSLGSSVSRGRTKVTVHLQHAEGFEIIKGY